MPTRQRKATSFDIAYMAGVSQPTVSRALRGSPTVSEETRKRIESIARQLNYTVDKNASSLRSQQTHTLVLLFFEDPTSDDSNINPLFQSMLGSIAKAAMRSGYDLITSFQEMSENWHAAYADSGKADGLILLGYGDYEVYRARLDQLVEQGTHFVRWGSVVDAPAGSTIGCDNRQGGRDATAHLLGLGRRRIAFLGTANPQYPEFLGRYRGHMDMLASAGHVVDLALQVDALTTEAAGYAAAKSLLDQGVEFDAIFAASDLIAIGAIHALQDAGKSVPGDVAVIGFDDISAASLTTPPLTTIRQDVTQAGQQLVEMLINRIRGNPVENRMLPGQLIIRKSCGGLVG